jgi:2-polyprenyl-3-methyl-5-hydroxy-6-metoxy-1,4-benzoquinol methylase
MWRRLVALFLLFKWKLIIRFGPLRGAYEESPDLAKVRWISPQRIAYCALQEFDIYDYKGHVIGGEWDRLEKKFEDLDVYIAFKQVCLEGRDWSETIFYQHILDEINQGHLPWGCRDKNDFDRRCRELTSLFNNIKRDGYRSQRELLSSPSNIPQVLADEVTVSIGRHGDFLFSDGAHRLAIAKLLGVPVIPVEIAVRHPGWVQFRKEILQYTRENGGKTYQSILHPDLKDIPAFHDCDDRFGMILSHMSCRQGRLLDIGANWGHFCHCFEDQGFECYALEDFPIHLHFLEKLKRAENKQFKTIAKSALASREIRDMYFDVVLALNIFHHFLKTKEDYEKFIDLLHHLQMGELFFEPHCPKEQQMQTAYRNFSPSEFVEFVMTHSSLKRAGCIGTAQDGRSLYRLYNFSSAERPAPNEYR